MIKVDKEKCIGCGLCVSMCPGLFELKDGKSHVKGGMDKCKECDCDIDAIIKGCPASAISK